MLVKIIKIKDNNLTVEKEGKERTYIMEDFVISHAKLGVADIVFNDSSQTISYITMQKVEGQQYPEEKDQQEQGETIPGNHIVDIKGKKFMTYEGLLAKAHKKGKFSMEITGSWVSEDMTRAWCKVRLTVGKQIYDGFGSSTPENTGTMTQSHPVEMAHTRAKGRALRDYLNIGVAMAEELKQGK